MPGRIGVLYNGGKAWAYRRPRLYNGGKKAAIHKVKQCVQAGTRLRQGYGAAGRLYAQEKVQAGTPIRPGEVF
ncbi:MAG: hypothetical protein WCP12_08765 [bacterium]